MTKSVRSALVVRTHPEHLLCVAWAANLINEAMQGVWATCFTTYTPLLLRDLYKVTLHLYPKPASLVNLRRAIYQSLERAFFSKHQYSHAKKYELPETSTGVYSITPSIPINGARKIKFRRVFH